MALLEIRRIKDGRAILGVVGKARYSFSSKSTHWDVLLPWSLMHRETGTKDAGSPRASTGGQLAVSITVGREMGFLSAGSLEKSTKHL